MGLNKRDRKFRRKVPTQNGFENGLKRRRGYGKDMTRISIIFLMLAGLSAVGLVVLSNWQIPAPTVAINKVISNETLPK